MIALRLLFVVTTAGALTAAMWHPGPPPRSLKTARGPRPRPDVGDALERMGAAIAWLGGRRPSPRRDRRIGVGLLVIAAAAFVGIGPALIGCLGGATWRRWRRLRSTNTKHDPALTTILPEVCDLLLLCVGAGESLAMAIETAATAGPDLVRPPFAAARRAIERGTAIREAVEELGVALGPGAGPLVAVIADHARYGTPLEPGLARVSPELRRARRRSNETAARRLPVLLLFPLVFCTLPAFGLLTVAPIVAGTLRSLQGTAFEASASAHPLETKDRTCPTAIEFSSRPTSPSCPSPTVADALPRNSSTTPSVAATAVSRRRNMPWCCWAQPPLPSSSWPGLAKPAASANSSMQFSTASGTR